MLIIVPEGRVTEVEYFGHLSQFNKRLHLRVERCQANSPQQLKKRLTQLMRQALANRQGVTGWIVFDRDRWNENDIQDVYKWQDKEPQVHIAMTNPKFEWWLALHFEAHPQLDRLVSVLVKYGALVGGNKKGVNTRVFDGKSIWKAIERASAQRSQSRIPGTRETDVHVLARQIISEPTPSDS